MSKGLRVAGAIEPLGKRVLPALRLEEADKEVFHFHRVSCAIAIVLHAGHLPDEDQRRLRLLRPA